MLESLERRGMLSAAMVSPATFYATSLTDAVAPGTLRQAVIQANATPGADTIMLRAGTYRLTLAGADEDAAATGDLDILQNLTIQGAGAMQTIIDASALGDRVFDARGANLVIKNATILGGRAQQGAGVSMVDGNLTLQNCRLFDNIAAGVDEGNGEGGGIYHENGSLVVQRTRFIGNQAMGAAAAVDGGSCAHRLIADEPGPLDDERAVFVVNTATFAVALVDARGDVVEQPAVLQRQVAVDHGDAGTLLGSPTEDGGVLDDQVRAAGVEHPVTQRAGVDDRLHRARALDGEILEDVEVAGCSGVFVGPGQRQPVGPGPQHDGVGARRGVRLNDGLPECSRGNRVGQRGGVERRRRNHGRRKHSPPFERLEHQPTLIRRE